MIIYQDRLGTKIGKTLKQRDAFSQEAIEQSGARMHWIEGDRDACKAAMAKFCEETGTVNMTYARNPYFNQVRKRIFMRRFVLQMIVLPREARDKHRESTQKEMRFCCRATRPSLSRLWSRCRKHLFGAIAM
eukprot:COSAG06_NODE_310_length_17775_cov_9.971374_4_plen_132_part_00